MSVFTRLARAGAVAASMFAAAGLSNMAQAVPAISVTNTTANSLGAGQTFTLGYQFTTDQSISVSALGVFDSDQDGLVDSYPVAIWNSSGAQVASGIVASGTSEPLVAQFRYQTVSSVTLSPGTYQIGALYTTSDDGVLFPGFTTGFSTAAPVAFVQNAFAFGSTLADPINSTSALPSFVGPNFQFDAAATPEPASIAVIGAGLVALVAVRRRHKR
jgi:hypothetical protein